VLLREFEQLSSAEIADLLQLTVNLQLTEEYKASLTSPAASVSTRIHNAFVAGYRNASETMLGFVLFFAESGPTLLIWLNLLWFLNGCSGGGIGDR